jgi:hypothetical protein
MMMKTLTITIGDNKGIFNIDMDSDREREVILEFGHRKATTSLMGFLQALGLIIVVEEHPLLTEENLHIK